MKVLYVKLCIDSKVPRSRWFVVQAFVRDGRGRGQRCIVHVVYKAAGRYRFAGSHVQRPSTHLARAKLRLCLAFPTPLWHCRTVCSHPNSSTSTSTSTCAPLNSNQIHHSTENNDAKHNADDSACTDRMFVQCFCYSVFRRCSYFASWRGIGLRMILASQITVMKAGHGPGCNAV